MSNIGVYAKAILSIVAAAIAVLVTALTDGAVSSLELVQVSIAVVTAVGVYLVPNLASGPAAYLKLVVAVLGAGLAALVTVFSDGVTAAEWLTVALAGLAAIGVGVVPNAEP